jgi:hypothetical protein
MRSQKHDKNKGKLMKLYSQLKIEWGGEEGEAEGGKGIKGSKKQK